MFKEIMHLISMESSIAEIAEMVAEIGSIDDIIEAWILDNMEVESDELSEELLEEVTVAVRKYFPEIAIAEEDEEDEE